MEVSVTSAGAQPPPRGSVLVQIDAAPPGEDWRPLYEIVAGFAADGVVRVLYEERAIGPPYVVTLLGIETVGDFELCADQALHRTVAQGDFTASGLALVAYRLCPLPPSPTPAPGPATDGSEPAGLP